MEIEFQARDCDAMKCWRCDTTLPRQKIVRRLTRATLRTRSVVALTGKLLKGVYGGRAFIAFCQRLSVDLELSTSSESSERSEVGVGEPRAYILDVICKRPSQNEKGLFSLVCESGGVTISGLLTIAPRQPRLADPDLPPPSVFQAIKRSVLSRPRPPTRRIRMRLRIKSASNAMAMMRTNMPGSHQPHRI